MTESVIDDTASQVVPQMFGVTPETIVKDGMLGSTLTSEILLDGMSCRYQLACQYHFGLLLEGHSCEQGTGSNPGQVGKSHTAAPTTRCHVSTQLWGHCATHRGAGRMLPLD